MNDLSLALGSGTYDSTLGFVISGGANETGFSSSFEATLDGSSFTTLNPMPIKTYMHCLVSLDNGGDIFMAGGYSNQAGGPSNRTYVYRNRDSGSSVWERQQDMPAPNLGMLFTDTKPDGDTNFNFFYRHSLWANKKCSRLSSPENSDAWKSMVR